MKKRSFVRTLLWFIALMLIGYGTIQAVLPMIEYTSEVNTTSEEVNEFITYVENQANNDSEPVPSDEPTPEFTGRMVGIITVDSIKLKAPIALGTDEDTLHQYVGMYEELDTFETEGGVVGLAAHSTRSSSPCAYCYFQQTSDIQVGDIIHILWKDGTSYKYVVYDVAVWREENTPGMFDRVDGKTVLVLQTCTNGQAGIRSYVHAERIKERSGQYVYVILTKQLLPAGMLS